MPDYYNKAFQGGPRIGNKPEERFRSGLMGQINPMAREMGRIQAVGSVMGRMSNFANKLPGPIGSIAGSMFGSNDKPSARDMLMYNYSRVGALQARAESETDPKRLAKINKKIDKSKGAVEKYAYKLDQKYRPGSKFLPPRTFDEIDAGRNTYLEKMTAGPQASTRTIKRTL